MNDEIVVRLIEEYHNQNFMPPNIDFGCQEQHLGFTVFGEGKSVFIGKNEGHNASVAPCFRPNPPHVIFVPLVNPFQQKSGSKAD